VPVRGWPARCPGVPLHRQGHPKILSKPLHRNDLRDPPLSGGASAPLRPGTKGQAGACPDPTRAIPCTVRAVMRLTMPGAPEDGVPVASDRMVISGKSRSFTDTPHRRSPAMGRSGGQVHDLCKQVLAGCHHCCQGTGQPPTRADKPGISATGQPPLDRPGHPAQSYGSDGSPCSARAPNPAAAQPALRTVHSVADVTWCCAWLSRPGSVAALRVSTRGVELS